MLKKSLIGKLIVMGIVVASLLVYFMRPAPEPLEIYFKDQVPDLVQSEPTITEIALQRDDGTWEQAWSHPQGKTLILEPGGADQLLAKVNLPAGTYVNARLFIPACTIKMDFNFDGDSDDTIEVWVVSQELWETVPHPPEGPTFVDEITEWRPYSEEAKGYYSPTEEQLQKLETEGKYLWFEKPETVTRTSDAHIFANFDPPWVYDGSGGKLLFDLTLAPGVHRGEPERIIATVTATS